MVPLRFALVLTIILVNIQCMRGFHLAAPRLLRRSSLAIAPSGARRSGTCAQTKTTCSVVRLGMAADAGESSQPSSKSVKTQLMDLLTQGTGLKGAADTRNREQVNEIVLMLERMNPTASPAESDLLNGDWDMLYTGGYAQGFIDSPTRELALLVYTGGFRPGLLANLMDKLPAGLLDVDYVEVKISGNAGDARVEGSVAVGLAGNMQKLTTEGTLVKKSPMRLTETFNRARAFGQAAELPGPLKLSRDLLVTYLDNDIFIARDESNVPDVWLRKVPLTSAAPEATKPDPESLKPDDDMSADTSSTR